MRLYDFPIARIIEFDCEKNIYAEPVGHFTGIVPLRDDLLQTRIEKRGIGSSQRSSSSVSQMNRRYNPFFSSFSSDTWFRFSWASNSLSTRCDASSPGEDSDRK